MLKDVKNRLFVSQNTIKLYTNDFLSDDVFNSRRCLTIKLNSTDPFIWTNNDYSDIIHTLSFSDVYIMYMRDKTISEIEKLSSANLNDFSELANTLIDKFFNMVDKLEYYEWFLNKINEPHKKIFKIELHDLKVVNGKVKMLNSNVKKIKKSTPFNISDLKAFVNQSLYLY